MIPKSLKMLIAAVLLPALAACAGAPAAGIPADPVPRFVAADHALSMVGKPYRYGGYTPDGFDCSGLVHYSFRRAGLNLPRDTRTLQHHGDGIDRGAMARGDLVFFDQEGKKSSHVGIYLGDGTFVHAPSSGGRVRVDRMDDRYWQRHFSTARRI